MDGLRDLRTSCGYGCPVAYESVGASGGTSRQTVSLSLSIPTSSNDSIWRGIITVSIASELRR